MLGLFAAEKADVNDALTYFAQAYNSNRYNRLAFDKISRTFAAANLTRRLSRTFKTSDKRKPVRYAIGISFCATVRSDWALRYRRGSLSVLCGFVHLFAAVSNPAGAEFICLWQLAVTILHCTRNKCIAVGKTTASKRTVRFARRSNRGQSRRKSRRHPAG